MPASLTRVCPSCNTERRTPDDFRDVGEERRPGRPPRTCRDCRETYPGLALAYEETKARRDRTRDRARELAERPAVVIGLDMFTAHPDGMKTCPPVAGCGKPLPLESFHLSKHQRDGLNPVCSTCDSERAALRKSRNA